MKFLKGHISIGPFTFFGNNAMHWAVNIDSKKYGVICFKPYTFRGPWCHGYFYLSPNGTPWASTFMIGKRANPTDWALSRVRLHHFGHNFNVDDNYAQLRVINDLEGCRLPEEGGGDD